jgi:hypothetical protein
VKATHENEGTGMNHADTIRDTVDATVLTPLVQARLDSPEATISAWQHEPFGHSLDEVYGTSRSIFRFSGTAQTPGGDVPWRLVLKIVPAAETPDDPSAPSNGAREPLAYQSGFLDRLTGVRAPHCAGVTKGPSGHYWLWLEEVVEGTGRQWPRERYLLAARHLARFNAAHQAGQTTAYPWLSRSPLREALKDLSAGVARIHEARRDNPFVARAVSEDAAAALCALPGKTHTWLDRLDTLPQTICHWDAHRANLVSRTIGPPTPSGPGQDERDETVALDWAGVGWGPVGSELSNFLSQTVNFFGMSAAALPDLDAAMFDHYVAGLRETGWEGDPRAARFGHAAASAARLVVRTASALELAIHTSSREAFERATGLPFATLADMFGTTLPYYLSLTDEAERLVQVI